MWVITVCILFLWFFESLFAGGLAFFQVEGSDYINANFLDGHGRSRAYIATQVSNVQLSLCMCGLGGSLKALAQGTL